MSQDRRRVIMTRKLRVGQEDLSFDLEFWGRLGSERRFAATWDAVVDLVRMGKLDGSQLRLQRSVARVVRRAS